VIAILVGGKYEIYFSYLIRSVKARILAGLGKKVNEDVIVYDRNLKAK
jgi:hypothetical protein